ncbi:hypothetical protein MX551_001602 [Salmonella enterica]|nr:hypothetical protein [Salmonella enterica]EDR4374957.1 hypothetical protein [Salmonella enterica]EEG5731746.1 hypothetical protein [Salmonella enterica]EEG6156110.1 hypothetical protein [Salmonella enterica]EEH7432225.1 hypothetical protein [Salmonella enterica]
MYCINSHYCVTFQGREVPFLPVLEYGSQRRFNLPDGGGKRLIRLRRVLRRPGKRRATGHVAG